MLLELNEATASRRRIPLYLVDSTDGVTPKTGLTFSGTEIQVSQNGGSFTSFAGTVTEVGSGLYYYEATSSELGSMGFGVVKVVKTGVRTFVAQYQVIALDPFDSTAWGMSRLDQTIGSRAASTQLPAALVSGRVDASVGAMQSNVMTAAAAATDFGQELADALLDRSLTGHTTVGTVGDRLNRPSGAVVSDAGNSSLTFMTNLTEAVTNYWVNAFIKFTSGALVGQVQKIQAYNGATKVVTMVTAFTGTPAASDTFIIINQ